MISRKSMWRLFGVFFALAAFGAACGGDEAEEDFWSDVARDNCRRACGDLNPQTGIDPMQCVEASVITECQDACLRTSTSSAEAFDECVKSYFFDDGCAVTGCLDGIGVDSN